MAPSKIKGIDNKSYQEYQEKRQQEDLSYSINQSIQNLEFDVDRLEKKLNELIAKNNSDKKDTDIHIQNTIESCMSCVHEFRQKIGDHKSYIEDQNVKITAFKSLVENLSTKKELNQEIESVLKCQSKLKENFLSFKEDVVRFVEHNKQDIIDQINRFKEDINSRPSEIPQFKKLMDEKLELIELNGQNSVLRSCNNERNILLIERKIDNIYQLIKKIDISNQESK